MQLHLAEPDPLTAVVTVTGDSLDINHAQAFRDQIAPAIDSHRNVLIDLSALRFVDSAGLGALLSALRRTKAKQGELRLYGLTPPVTALFHLVRMHRVFAIFTTLEDTLRGLD